VVTFSSIALADSIAPIHAERGLQATRMFAPWLLLAIVAMPERGLFSQRNLILLSLLAIAVWLTLATSALAWPSLLGVLPLGLLPWSAGAVASGLTFAAAMLCILRWVLTGSPMEAGLGIVLGLAGLAELPNLHLDTARIVLALAGACSLASVLYASYRMAFVDALSGLPNRRALDETLARTSGNYALAMVDIDHFKRFNDTHGHAAGDRVLQSVAQQLRRTRSGRAFRYGGEEFCLLFSRAQSRNALKACEDARARVEALRVRVRSTPSKARSRQAVKRVEANDVKVTISIGLARRDAQTPYPSDVLKAADVALYKAKGKGRNRVVSH
ncbi:MAG: GGDEF domain-containing protein, partial [Rudaea sp.]